MRRLNFGVMADTSRFKGEAVRDTLRKRGFLTANVVRYCYRPFDVRWLYWEPETDLLDRKREDYFAQVFEGNVWLSATQRNRKDDFYQPQFIRTLADHHIVESNVGMFPLYLRSDGSSLLEAAGARPNLSKAAGAYLDRLGAEPEDLFYHALAVLHAPAYRSENAGALRQEWPRVPLPGWGAESTAGRIGPPPPAPRAGELLRASAALGRRVAALLDGATPVPGVTCGAIRDDLRAVAVCVRADGRPVNPDAGDLDVTAGWGHAGQGGVTMPGRGRMLPCMDADLEGVGRQSDKVRMP